MKNGGRRVIFVSGDHPEPTDFVTSVFESFGFVAVYLGDLATAAASSRRAARSPVVISAISTASEPPIANARSADQGLS